MPHRKTFARDYRNTPGVDGLSAYDAVAISARATPEAVVQLKGQGVFVYAWVQPVIAVWEGRPVTDFEWDSIRWQTMRDDLLRQPNGDPIAMQSDNLGGAYCIDFSRKGFTLAGHELSYLADRGFQGVLFDYGTDDLSWFKDLATVSQATWQQWRVGYRLYREMHRRHRPILMQTNRTEALHNGLYLEGLGSLTKFHLVPGLVAGQPSSVILRQNDSSAGHWLTAVSLVHDCFVEYNPLVTADGRLFREPERFDLDLGAPVSMVTTTQTRLRRNYERGFAEYDPESFASAVRLY